MCPLCASVGGTLLIEREHTRIIRADEPDYPGFCRVIWRDHQAEMTDLTPAQRAGLMLEVFAVERAVRALFAPDKVNLASLGNVVAHVHWHVIARRRDDRHFPLSVWSAPQRELACVWPAVSDAELARAIAAELALAGV
jgi:diadenosine tetraphosphate (Ap4A) HIT family hydrolase